jgi:hypothetical protein
MPSGLSLEEFGTRSVARNPRIASLFHRTSRDQGRVRGRVTRAKNPVLIAPCIHVKI